MGAEPGVGRGDRRSEVVVKLVTDPPGKTEYPALPRLTVAIHVGRAVYMSCSRAGQNHRGLGVHGDIDIIPAGTPAVWEPDDFDTVLAVGLDPKLVDTVAEDLGIHTERLEIRNRFQIRDLQIENIGWALKLEMESGYPNGRIFRDSLATALATCLLNRHSSASAATASPNGALTGHRLKQVLSYIEDNLSTGLSLDGIAKVAGVSSSHCKLIFRRAMGVPVHQYVTRRRVERAKDLLLGGTLPISQVAEQTGFAHQSHLARQMRRILGHAPKAVRAASETAWSR